MNKEKRYRVTMSFYEYAKDEVEAVQKAKQRCETMEDLEDNQPSVDHMSSVPYGKEHKIVNLNLHIFSTPIDEGEGREI